MNDGSCIYPEDNGWCDCDGNVEDCFGECGGDAVIDECGECNGDNVSCIGCTDSNADNFDPDAIVSCEDCCEYPNYDGLIVINEINYNPGLSFDQADADYEFIELYNNSSASIDLSGWSLISDNINFTFDNFEADAGAYILLARNTDTYPESISYGDNSLSNSGESITLTDLNQQLVDIVTYSDGFQGDDDPWPQAADAEGATLELISADLDNSIASSWQASFVIPGGTPGYENSSEPVDVEGCTDSSACNYDAEATLDDGSCEYEVVLGCTDDEAVNYNEEATDDDGSCTYISCEFYEMLVEVQLMSTSGNGWETLTYELSSFDGSIQETGTLETWQKATIFVLSVTSRLKSSIVIPPSSSTGTTLSSHPT